MYVFKRYHGWRDLCVKVYFKKPIKREKREFIFTSERVKKNVLICVVHCGCDSCRKRRVLTYQHTLWSV